MPSELILDINKETLKRLKLRAKINKRSLKSELRCLLEEHGNYNAAESQVAADEILNEHRTTKQVLPDRA
ncbi:MAG: hypothetical protein FH748_11300 [Balneolaceae bacterium]|nr:hypothetical protein [Balneolaceae bacterium]